MLCSIHQGLHLRSGRETDGFGLGFCEGTLGPGLHHFVVDATHQSRHVHVLDANRSDHHADGFRHAALESCDEEGHHLNGVNRFVAEVDPSLCTRWDAFHGDAGNPATVGQVASDQRTVNTIQSVSNHRHEIGGEDIHEVIQALVPVLLSPQHEGIDEPHVEAHRYLEFRATLAGAEGSLLEVAVRHLLEGRVLCAESWQDRMDQITHDREEGNARIEEGRANPHVVGQERPRVPTSPEVAEHPTPGSRQVALPISRNWNRRQRDTSQVGYCANHGAAAQDVLQHARTRETEEDNVLLRQPNSHGDQQHQRTDDADGGSRHDEGQASRGSGATVRGHPVLHVVQTPTEHDATEGREEAPEVGSGWRSPRGIQDEDRGACQRPNHTPSKPTGVLPPAPSDRNVVEEEHADSDNGVGPRPRHVAVADHHSLVLPSEPSTHDGREEDAGAQRRERSRPTEGQNRGDAGDDTEDEQDDELGSHSFS